MEESRKALNNLKTVKGSMTTESKKGFDIMFCELERNNKKLNVAYNKINALDKKVDDLSVRLNIMETATAETLKIVNSINEKITVDKVEEKAAQMDFLQRIVSSKFGKIVIGILFCAVLAAGIGVVYIINHSNEVTELVDSIKK